VSDAPRAPAAPWPAVQEGHVEGTKHGSGEGLLADRGVTRRSTRSWPTRFPTRWGTIEAARGRARPVYLRPALAAAEAATREGHAVPHPEGFDPAL